MSSPIGSQLEIRKAIEIWIEPYICLDCGRLTISTSTAPMRCTNEKCDEPHMQLCGAAQKIVIAVDPISYEMRRNK